MGVMWPDRRRCHVQLQRCRSFVCAALRTGIVPRKHKCRAVRGVPSASALPRSSARSGGPSPCGSVLIVFSGHAEDARHPIASQEPAAETDQNPTRYPTLQPLHARGESPKTFSRETLPPRSIPYRRNSRSVARMPSGMLLGMRKRQTGPPTTILVRLSYAAPRFSDAFLLCPPRAAHDGPGGVSPAVAYARAVNAEPWEGGASPAGSGMPPILLSPNAAARIASPACRGRLARATRAGPSRPPALRKFRYAR